MRLLLEHGADPESKETEYGQTPLSRAAERGHVMIVRLLLGREGVEPDTKDRYGRTPLLHGHEAVVRLPLE